MINGKDTMTTKFGRCWLQLAVLLAGLALNAGCFKIETHVKLNEDGSAIMTERIWFSKQVMDLAGDQRATVKALLGREQQLERVKRMGSDLKLISHEMREGGDGWVESIAKIEIPDLDKTNYASPWLAAGDYASNNTVRIRCVPRYKSDPYGGGAAGTMMVYLEFPKRRSDAPAPAELSPVAQQVYRDIAPALRDMLKGLHLSFTFASYAPIGGRMSETLLDVSDKNLDQLSQMFFENEEIMLELARLDFGGPNIVANVYKDNTLPAFLPIGSRAMWWMGSQNLWFRPSRQLFDRYFAGKKLDYSPWQDSAPEQQKNAKFEDIGWHPAKADDNGKNIKQVTAP